MKKKLISFSILVILTILTVTSQTLKSPSIFLGYELGSRFTRHNLVIDYFKEIESKSPNLKLIKYGETNEFRPLYVSFISSEENIKNIETIRIDNLKRTGIIEGTSNSEIAIVWLSYNVHGNEASSTEAAMQTIFELITTKQEWLKNTIVIIDPCMNPDGRDRFVNWYNENKSSPYNTNPEATEHHEPWPNGRANHYLFDLNRDWAWASQIETQQRLKIYNKWLPQVHVDFHEQGYESPYYFAPAAKPFHEVITDWQRNFQTQIGKNNANYFDENGWRYFTKEIFDLLYPSYGDTYPTYLGAIGMTFEQAGIGAGLGITIENKTELSLIDRITHHKTTGLSTIEMTSKNAKKLVAEFEKFYANTNSKYKSYILRSNNSKIAKIKTLLAKHEIEMYPAEEKTVKAYDYYSKSIKTIKTTINDWIVTTNQPKGTMVKVLFEPEAKLTDSLTYDITAWSLPFAYGIQGFSAETLIKKNVNYKETKTQNVNEIHKNNYAYINKWEDVSDAAFLGGLLEERVNVRFSYKNFSVEGTNFNKGSLIVMRGENKHLSNFDEVIIELGNKFSKKLTSVNTGFVNSGSDFGSDSMSLIKNKKVAALSGEGTSSLGFGEIWHFFETQLNYPLHVINTRNFNNTDFSKYDVLILPNGYSAEKKALEILTNYAMGGGTIISIGSSLKSFADKEGFDLKSKKDTLENKNNPNLLPYNQRERNEIKETITGSIFKSPIDATHPLAFGYENNYYSLKLSGNSYKLLENGENVGYFSENTTNISGFAGSEALKQVPNSLLFGVEHKGKGELIYMVDNPLFRSFWENGKLFFVNAVFLN